jgi:acetyltransferase-like isoleucine patch superfamily enzyme
MKHNIGRIKRRVGRAINTKYYRYKFHNTSLIVGYGTEILVNDVIMGENVVIDQNVQICGELQGKLLIGNNSQINSNSKIDTTGCVEIGENTVVSEYCKLYSHGHKGNPNNPAAPYTLKIGDDVWIGAGCIVLPSVEFIENGSVIPAGTVVR